MIKFFRKIRQNLLMENKIGKYFKYAIGEILLVVIGILIALQINNANQAKANEDRFLSVLQEIHTDLSNDVRNGYFALRRGKLNDSLYLKVLNNELTAADYKNNSDYQLFWLGLNNNSFEYQKSGFAKFENFAGVIPKQYEYLAGIISRHYSVHCLTFDTSNKSTLEGIRARHDYMAKNFSWYHQMQQETKSDEIIAFYLENPIYKNWIFQSYQFSITGSNTSTQIVLASAFNMLILISDILGTTVPVPKGDFYIDFLGKDLTPKEMEVAGAYADPESGWEFDLEIKAGFLMFKGLSLLKKIDEDKYQSLAKKDWYYQVIRNDSGQITEFIINDTGNKKSYHCFRTD